MGREISSQDSRKPRATSLVTDDDSAIYHGKFLRALRNRARLTCEQLAEHLGYKRPTQVLRRESGLSGIPLSEISQVAKYLNCSVKLLLFSRIITFETPYSDVFGQQLFSAMGIDHVISPPEFFRHEIAAIMKDNSTDEWEGASLRREFA